MSDQQDQAARNSINQSGTGNVIGAVGQGDKTTVTGTVTITPQASEATNQINDLVAKLQQRIDQFEDDVEKQMAQVAVDGLKKELQKGEAADESILQKRMDSLRKLAQDAFEVAVATIANPAAGFAIVAQKVAKKAQEQTQ